MIDPPTAITNILLVNSPTWNTDFVWNKIKFISMHHYLFYQIISQDDSYQWRCALKDPD